MMTVSYLYAKFIKKYLIGKAILNSKIHKTAKVYSGCNIVNTQIGRYSYCGYNCTIANCDIGAFCSISDHVFIGGAEHPINWGSTSPVFQKVKHSGPKKRFSQIEIPKTKKTTIGNDVWIGHGVTIKQGITVGTGSIVGSNSMVTKDIPAYAIVGGNPAKIIRFRFTENIRDNLIQSQWWNWSDEEILHVAPYINDINNFLEAIRVH